MTKPIGGNAPSANVVGTSSLFSFAGQHAAAGSVDHTVHTDGQGPDIIGTSGDDFLLGTNSSELIMGLNGNDELIGFGHADTIDGGNGDDIIDGGKGNDTLYGRNGHDIILGEQGNDTIVGGGGTDWAYYHNALFGGSDSGSVTVDLSLHTGTDQNGGTDYIVSTEDVIGTLNADVITGDAGDNLLSGYFGADTLSGGAGNDYLETGGGLHTVIDGGDGSDTVFLFSNADGAVKVDLSTTTEQMIASDTSATITNVENVSGYYYNDTIIGSSSDNKLYGDFGNDILRGGDGNDALYGDGFDHGDGQTSTDAYSVGDDTLVGGAGNDTLDGGGGADNLQGGFGSNTFVYEFLSDSGVQSTDAIDHITDLTNADSIDLTALEANYGVTLTQVASFDASGAGEITLTYDKHAGTDGTTYMKVDMDGDGKADMTVALDGDHRDFTNFVL